MSTRLVLSIAAAAAVLWSPLVFAAPDGSRNANSTAGSESAGLTREEVKRELEAARRDGSLRASQRNANYPSNPTHGKATSAGFVSSPAQRSEASRTAQPPTSSGGRFIGGEAGRIHDAP
jgi:hypothetical protein